MGKDMVLPKNIRQIGDVHGNEKIYMEDYVMTYIRKKERQDEKSSIGILLGERYEDPDGVFVFVRGICEIPQEETGVHTNEAADRMKKSEAAKQAQRNEAPEHMQKDETEKTARKKAADCARQATGDLAEKASENGGKKTGERLTLKEKIHRERVEHFSGWDVQGCCVIGKYCPEIFEQLSEILPEALQMIYHLQEQEETVYWRAKEGYRRVQGYFVFYEQNRRMQEYLSEVFGETAVEQESIPERAIKSFREKVREKGEQKTGSMLRLASSFFVITVLVAGAVVVNRVDEIRKVQNVTNISSKEENGQWDLEYTKERMQAQQEAQEAAVQQEAQEEAVQQEAQEAAVQQEAQEAAVQQAQADSAELLSGADGRAEKEAQEAEDNGAEVWQDEAGNAGGTLQKSLGEAEVQEAALQQAQAGEVQSAETQDGEAAAGERQRAQEQEEKAQEAAQSDGKAEQDAAWMAGSDAFWEDEEQQSLPMSEESGAQQQEAAQETAARGTQASYVIKSGDTLANICKQYYGSIEYLAQICEANHISDANMIMPGQKIVLP